MTISYVNRNMLWLALGWTLSVLLVVGVFLNQSRENTIERVEFQAQSLLERDLLYRQWGLSKGGLYLHASKENPPNIHLASLPDRDIVLPNGQMLTLISPSSITRQAFDLSNMSGNTLSKITAVKVLNPANLADSWEASAIEQFKDGVSQVTELGEINAQAFVRVMRPFVTEERCIKCHSAQGYS
ncbi:MAG: DUF3365 domain-containing protein, partial [Desulfuromonadales bacterium]|nr:DUF3365 domain-containing protein [Desulfuromonadales bacterium]